MPGYGAGVIAVDACQVETEHSFLDYIAGGCELNFLVAGIQPRHMHALPRGVSKSI
jgi:hypothetical protein